MRYICGVLRAEDSPRVFLIRDEDLYEPTNVSDPIRMHSETAHTMVELLVGKSRMRNVCRIVEEVGSRAGVLEQVQQ